MGEGTAGGVLPLAGDVMAASAALAGFILVYLSALATAYAGYDVTDRKAVLSSFRQRAWFAVGGIIFSIAACTFGTLAKWFASTTLAGWSLFFLFATLFW